jgi:hypothetical protein
MSITLLQLPLPISGTLQRAGSHSSRRRASLLNGRAAQFGGQRWRSRRLHAGAALPYRNPIKRANGHFRLFQQPRNNINKKPYKATGRSFLCVFHFMRAAPRLTASRTQHACRQGRRRGTRRSGAPPRRRRRFACRRHRLQQTRRGREWAAALSGERRRKLLARAQQSGVSGKATPRLQRWR